MTKGGIKFGKLNGIRDINPTRKSDIENSFCSAKNRQNYL